MVTADMKLKDTCSFEEIRKKKKYIYIYIIEIQLTYNVSGAQQGDSVIQMHIYYF